MLVEALVSWSLDIAGEGTSTAKPGEIIDVLDIIGCCLIRNNYAKAIKEGWENIPELLELQDGEKP